MKKFAIIVYVISFIPIFVGLNKLFVYENPDSYVLSSTNNYVVGDTYNYIINARQASAYFTLAILIAMIASVLFITSILNDTKKKQLFIRLNENLKNTESSVTVK